MFRRIHLFASLLFALLAKPLLADESLDLAAVLEDARRGVVYQAVARDELAAVEPLFLETLQHQRPFEELSLLWKHWGWEMREWEEPNGVIWTLMESENDRRGRGRFAFRPGGNQIVLQAPHSFYDSHTGELARQLFLEGSCVAVAWNSVHRKTVDVAHVQQHYFNAFTAAIAQADTATLVVQLHGFGQSQRQSQHAADASMIMSNGARHPARWFSRLSTHFSSADYGDILLYPYDISELGATTNEQGKVLRNAGKDSFLHLEMSESLRRRFLASPPLRHQLANDLEEVYRIFQ